MNHNQKEFFLQWNTSSLISHWGEFKNYILHNNPLIAAIQETKFNDSDASKYNFNIKGYCLYTNNLNKTPRQGGAAIYISNKLLHHQIHIQTTLNAVALKVKIAQLDITIVSIYLSPTHPIPPELISNFISQISSPCLILGDFNAHHMTWGCQSNSTRGKHLLSIMDKYNLIHINNLIPTHVTYRNGKASYSVIDLAITNPHIATLLTQYVADETLFSDHYPIHYQLKVPSGQTNFNFLPRWNFRKADWTSFQNHIDESLTSDPPPDINTFLNKILASAHQNIPHTRPPIRTRNAPWWNSECQRAVALRRQAMRAFKRCICTTHCEQVQSARIKASEIIKRAKQEGWEDFSNNFNRFTPLSKIWSMIKCFSNKSATHYKIPHLHINNTHYIIPLEVATQFATHYANISSQQQYTQQLTTSLNNTLSTLSFDSNNTEKYNYNFTAQELNIAIHKCGNTSVGPDQIAYPFFKNLTENSLTTLLSVINHLWENNYYPPSWRVSTLIPILKPRKPPSDPSSYRPISLTSCASKLLERMVNGRLRAYLETNKILSSYQNGFRPGRSTADSLVRILDSVQRGFQTKDITIALFLDLKSAFDKVNKTSLLINTHRIGIRGRMAHFIQEFLKNRQFNVRCGNTYSPMYNQDHGLPQGSVLSPSLFLIMINDICKYIPSEVKYSLYADDVAIWCTDYCVDRANRKIQLALTIIQQWCEETGLLISIAKSAAIIFTKRQYNFMPAHPLELYGEPIKYVKQYKYLGITLNSNLSFVPHFIDIKQRCARRLNIMKCIAGSEWGADRRTLLRLYTSLIRPILDYNGFLFDDIASHKIKILQTIQNDALRIVTGALKTTNIYNLHIETNIPLLNRRRKFQLLKFFARASTKPQEPTNLTLINTSCSGRRTKYHRKFPTIGIRIVQAQQLFNITPIETFPTPSIRAYWLDKKPNIHFLFTEQKASVSTLESKNLFNKFKATYANHTFIYTDGSKIDGKTGVGITSKHFNKSNRLHDIHSIFTAELQGILSALHQIKKQSIQSAVICTDSSSSLLAISSEQLSSHPIVHKIKNILNQLNNIEMLWIPGHTGIEGNETADTLAKDSLRLPSRNHLPCPLSDIQNHIHTRFRELLQREWDAAPNRHLHPIKPILKHTITSDQMNREKERVFARLRLGHTLLTHGHIFDNCPPPTCHKCNNNTRYTIQHFLIDCPHLHQHRQDISRYIQHNSLTMNLPTLLGDDHPELLELLYIFLCQTRLVNNI